MKAAVVSRALRASGLHEILVHTGQHYDTNMSAVFFEELQIPEPDYNLGIGSGFQGAQTGRMLESIEAVLLKESPGLVLIYGDTNSTIAGALAASKLHIQVGHVEAGLRSFNRRMPEEINRVVSDHLSDLLFTPTKTADDNLRNEGIVNGVHRVGDVMYDAVTHYRELASKRSEILSKLNIGSQPFALATIHRAENTDDPVRLKNILTALDKLAGEFQIVFPVHPRTRKSLESLKTNPAAAAGSTGRLHFTDPVSYLEMLILESEATVILTDSGGVQKEAYFFRVPCITLRAETEWVETVELGWNTLVDDRVEDILKAARDPRKGSFDGNPFGTGDASVRIASILAIDRQ